MWYAVHYAVNDTPNLLVARGNRSTCRKLGKIRIEALDEPHLHKRLDSIIPNMAKNHGPIEVVAILID